MEWLSSLFGAALSGGVTSLVSLGVQHWVDYKKAELANKHELSMADKRADEMKMELEISKQEGAQAFALERESGANDAFNAAIVSQGQMMQGASQWVIDICSLTRPVLTLLLVVIASVFVALAADHALANDFMFMATAATMYWFGDRARKK